MHAIRVVGTFRSAPVHVHSGVTDLLIGGTAAAPVLYAASRAGGGVMAIAVEPAQMTLLGWQTLASGAVLSAPSQLTLLDLAGSPALVVTGPDDGRLEGWRLQGSGALDAGVGVPGSPGRPVSAIATAEVGGRTFVYIVNQDGEGALRSGVLQPDGRMVMVDAQSIAATDPGTKIADLQVVQTGGRQMLVAVSRDESRLITFALGDDGIPLRLTALGASGGLGIAGPTEMVAATVGGATYMIVAGAVSSSLSVIRLWDTGEMALTDHVIDTRDTRFQGAGAVATVEIGGQTFVVAGGGDAGLTMFLLVPGGRLVLAGRLVDPGDTAIDNLQALALRHSGGVLDIFAAGEGAGVTRLQVDLPDVGLPGIGTAGADSLIGGTGADLLIGGEGRDTLSGRAGIDVLIDGAGEDSLYGGTEADTFVLMPDAAVDVIRDYQVGIDRIDLSNWGRVFSLDAISVRERPNGQLMLVWADEILFIASSNGARLRARDIDTIGAFDIWHLLAPEPVIDRVLRGGPGDEALTGGAGNDTLIGGAGADTTEGGPGIDVADYTASPGGVTVNLASGVGRGGHAEGDVLSGIEAVVGSGAGDVITGDLQANRLSGGGGADVLSGGSGNDSLSGDAGADTLNGDAGADTLRGGNDDDRLAGGAGSDVLDGGAGFDRVSYATETTGVRVDLTNSDPAGGAAAGDVLWWIEALEGTPFADVLAGSEVANTIVGLSGNDRMLGRGGNDTLWGNFGNDSLSGGTGTDRVSGGNGNDTLAGEAGRDILDGGAGFDVATYLAAGNTRVTVDLAAWTRNAGAAFGDRLFGVEGVIGAWSGDRLTGNAAANMLDGRGGADVLAGGRGNDRLLAGGGRDSLYGGDGADRLTPGPDRDADRLNGGTGYDSVDYGGARWLGLNLAQQWRNAGAAIGDRLAGIEAVWGSSAGDAMTGDGAANRFLGGWGNDRLAGAQGADALFGGGGRDRLDGGTGNDVMTGGTGADLFVFRSGRDRITDAARAEGDRLLVERDLFPRNLTEAQIITRHVRVESGDLVIYGGDGARLVVEDVRSKTGLAGWLDLI